MKVLCIGHASYDISCILDAYPIENSKNVITEKLENGGGQAANAACLLAKWGIETYIAAAIGSDSYGEKMKKEFEMFGVKTSLIETSFEKSTSNSFIMINKKSGTRTTMNISTADTSPHMKKEEFSEEPDAILVDGYEYHASVAALTKYEDKLTIIDAGVASPEVIELSKLCKYIVGSKDFAEKITGVKADINYPSSLVAMYTKLKERFPRAEIIITLEEFGALYVENEEIKVMPGIKIKALDTTGAGDVFHGSFVYGLINNYDIEKNIAYANIAAGLSCESLGGRLSIPNLNDVLTKYNEVKGVQNVVPNSAGLAQ